MCWFVFVVLRFLGEVMVEFAGWFFVVKMVLRVEDCGSLLG